MSHQVCAYDDPNTAADPAAQLAEAELRLSTFATDAGVFDESEIRQMEQVLAAVCLKLNIAADSDAQREAALCILRLADGDEINPERLTELVVAELSR